MPQTVIYTKIDKGNERLMLLELQNIKKYFLSQGHFSHHKRQYVKAVDGVHLSIQEGEHLGLVGESGCGKTTLGRIALRLLSCDEGRILFQGQDITHWSQRKLRFLRQELQTVFQDPLSSLDPRFTVRQILSEAMLFQKKNLAHQEQRQKELLSLVRLPKDILDRFPHEFSGGERQRIAIARALAVNPKLIILDEAVSSLDVLVQEEILNLLCDLQKRCRVTYFFISHNLRVIKKLCLKVAVMFQGKIIEMGPCEEIFRNPLHPYTQQLLSAALHYRVNETLGAVSLNDSAQWIDHGGGHFVLEN